MYQFYCAPDICAMGVPILLEQLIVEQQFSKATLSDDLSDKGFSLASSNPQQTENLQW